jgi:predicted DNA-binding WGR domain protein
MELPDSIDLYFREGTSDKVYHAEIVARGDGFVVNFAYGRRGAKMQTGSKTPKPVSRAKAEEIYSKLVTEKTDKGYVTDEPGAATTPPPRGGTKAHSKGESAAAEPVALDAASLEWDGDVWKKAVNAPAFKAFKYGGSQGKTDVVFYVDDKDDKPSPAAIAVAAKVLANQKELIGKVIQALWDDFNGEGPDTGMYWHGDLDQVAEGLEMADDEASPPKKANDLFKLMSCPTIAVHKEVDGYEKPIVELSFGAAFEEEHGVGILTDGAKIIGIGYSYDVTPFESDDDDDDGDGE